MSEIKLRSKLSLTFALVVLITVALISLLSNIFINNEFKKYVTKQQEQRTQEIISSISAQFNSGTLRWNQDFVHAIGMYALDDGYIIKISDASGQTVWSAEECDMASCVQLMSDVSARMRTKCPKLNGKFINKEFSLLHNGATVGTASISYYGPYFLSDNDFHFLDMLNIVLATIGISSLILSVIVGMFMAKRISDPIRKAADAAHNMSKGDYAARITAQSDTKELGELIGSVNLLAESLSHQESLRKQLTADVAHELRTPITSMQTHLEAMMEGMWEPTQERLASCHEEAMRIGTMVRDLEGLSKVDNENIILDKKPLDLSYLLNKTIDSFEMEIESKRLSVTVNGVAPEVSADEDRIRQVAGNLLSNAIKYTPQGGKIDIAISQTEEYAVFTITDNGAGIPDEELPFIFERFYRADKSRNRKTGGSGIGLAVVKAIVTAHGGTVEAESGVKQGSRFIIRLPIESA